MIYQCNVCVSVTTALFAALYLCHYFIANKNILLFWGTRCDLGFQCHEFYFSGPPHPHSKEFLSVLKDFYLHEPPKNPQMGEFDIYTPVWRKLVDWYKVQEGLIEVFKDQAPGFYVEVGAVDGEFMSQTLYLERTYGWTGLLIEPDPRSFQNLVNMKRNAWLSPLCVKLGYPCSNQYWLRRLETNLPHHFQQLLLARSKLENEILEGDEERGSFVSVPCSPLSSILKAINVSTVDLLTINTGGDEDLKKVLDVLKSKRFHVKFLLMHYSSNLLFNEAFPKVPGYIADTKRSFLLMKLYVRASSCQLIKQDACEDIETFSVVKACNLYICFGYLKVLSAH